MVPYVSELLIYIVYPYRESKIPRDPLPFDATVDYMPDEATKTRIANKNAESKQACQDPLQAAKEKLFNDTLRNRLELIGQVQTRPRRKYVE